MFYEPETKTEISRLSDILISAGAVSEAEYPSAFEKRNPEFLIELKQYAPSWYLHAEMG